MRSPRSRERRRVEASLCFIETSAFTRRIIALALETELNELQQLLRENPEAGSTDAGTGGLRKIRMPDSRRGKGKRSGVRAHYLHLAAHAVIYLIFVYSKDEQDMLSQVQKRQLKLVAEAIKREWDA